ncbi:MAG TPA: patatin-like phospholipase family protein [Bacteroidota bacterium]|nr:patatin-like phospholipase family protein [Bacteroidota bacterium]
MNEHQHEPEHRIVVRMKRRLMPAFFMALLACLCPHGLHAGSDTERIRPLPDRPTIALVLSGGGARGLSHVGVLRALEKHHIPIDFIVGSSMGAIIGGLYASGYTTQQLTDLIDTTEWKSILSLSDDYDRKSLFIEQKQIADRSQLVIRLDGLVPVIPSSISTGKNLSRFLNQLTMQSLYHPRTSFDDCKIPFRAVATDMISGQRIIIDAGNLSEAMRASVGVPLLYSAVKRDSMQLMDGGLMSNIPVDVARKLGADIVIAVDVTSPLRTADQLNMPWEIADQIIGIMAQAGNKKSLEEATIVIRPVKDKRLPSDFTDFDTLITQGERAVEQALPALRDSISASAARYAAVYASQTPAISLPIVRSVSISGATVLDSAELTGAIATLTPAPYSETLRRHVSDSLITKYRAHGYSLACVKSMYFVRDSSSLHVDIDEGVIDRIIIEGNEQTRDWVIWREIPFTEGDLFTFTNAERAIANLLATNLFEHAAIDFRYEGGKTIVAVQVRERHAELLRLGIRIDNERNVQPLLSLRDENLFGSATEAGIAFAGGLRNRKYGAEIKTSRIFNTYFNFSLSAHHTLRNTFVFGNDSTVRSPHRFNRIATGEYETVSYGGAFSIGRQVERLGIVSLEYKLEDVTLDGLSGAAPHPEAYSMQVFKLSSTIDAQDRYPFPRTGSLMNLSWETATLFKSGSPGYSRFFFSYEVFNTYFARHTFHPRIMFGYADKTLPLSQQFSLGGESMLYGTREDDTFGRQIFLANIEYRFALPFKIIWDAYASVRYDLGATWPEPKNIRLNDMQHGIGGGISIDTPLGPATMSIGRSFHIRQDIPKSPFTWGSIETYFSLGYSI